MVSSSQPKPTHDSIFGKGPLRTVLMNPHRIDKVHTGQALGSFVSSPQDFKLLMNLHRIDKVHTGIDGASLESEHYSYGLLSFNFNSRLARNYCTTHQNNTEQREPILKDNTSKYQHALKASPRILPSLTP